MPQLIKIPNSPESTQILSLSGVEYNLRLTFNTADKHWRLDIRDLDSNEIVSGLKIMPNQNLTWRYKYLENMPAGNIYCIRQKNDFSAVGRDNLGVDKTYTLVYLTEAEDTLIGFTV